MLEPEAEGPLPTPLWCRWGGSISEAAAAAISSWVARRVGRWVAHMQLLLDHWALLQCRYDAGYRGLTLGALAMHSQSPISKDSEKDGKGYFPPHAMVPRMHPVDPLAFTAVPNDVPQTFWGG